MSALGAVVCVPADTSVPRGLSDAPGLVRPAGGFAAAVNAAASEAGRAHVVAISPEARALPSDAVQRLIAAASDTVASVSALRPGGALADAKPDDVAAAALRLYPRIGEPVAGCVLLTRAALDLAGPLDESFTSAAGALAEFGSRCSHFGLLHVLADDVLATGDAAAISAGDAERLADVAGRRAAVARATGAEASPVHRARAALERDVRPVSVTVDARALGPQRAGTQVHVLELVMALARTGRADVRAVVAHDLADDAAEAFAGHPRITTITYEEATDGRPPRTDIVHRPLQVFTHDDLALLLPLGRRLVVTHQDLIAYHSPGYVASFDDWQRLRWTTRIALGGADHVVFFSEHALADALREDLVEASRASVVPIGVDHRVARSADPAVPAGFDAGAAPYLLCLGADLPHKNLQFAASVADRLRRDGWPGRLVIAGAPTGSGPAGALHLGPVSEAEKAHLLRHAAAAVYPTTYEGFGLVPFEAGAAGVPCAFAPVASLAEVLPTGLAVLEPWDAAASAERLRPLLDAGPERDAHVRALREAGGRFTWDAAAAGLLEVYARAMTSPLGEARRAHADRLDILARLDDEMRARQEEWEEFQAFRAEIGSDALGLVGPGGILDDADQRALLALASRRLVHRPLFGTLKLAYRAALRVRRR